MTYEVLARRWRPKVFEDLIGQETIARTLRNALSSNRVGHAYLFCGLRGIGKTSAARVFARAIRCEQRQPNSNPCNSCGACLEILEGRSLDVLEIDGASNNGVDAIRELREQANYLPSAGTTKIYIIDEVHMLSTSAFNALLKILEEPPAHLIFMFATTEPQDVPETILSRVQRFDFKRIPEHILTAHLKTIIDSEKISVEPQVLELIANASEGSMRDAQSMLDQLIVYCGTNLTSKEAEEVLGLVGFSGIALLMSSCLERDGTQMLSMIRDFYNKGVDLKQLILRLIELTRHCYFISTEPDIAIDTVSSEQRATLDALATKQDSAHWRMMFQLLNDGYDRLQSSPFPRLSIEMLLSRLMNLSELQTLQSLIDRLEKLPQGAATSSPPGPVAAKTTPRPAPSAPPVENPHVNTASQVENDNLWLGWLDSLRKERPSLAMAFQDAKVHIHLPQIRVDFRGTPGALLLDDPNIQRNLAPLAKEYFGQLVKWDFIGAKAGAAQGQPAGPNPKQALVSDERVKMAQKYLGAEVESVQVFNQE